MVAMTATANPKKTKSRLLLVDDHPIVRQGLAEMINNEKDLTVAGTAEDVHKALEAIEKLKPDLVVADISLKGSNGIELLKNIKVRFPKMLVLVLSMHDEALYAVRALRAGAGGYIMKQEATEKVLTAIRQVLAGEIYLSERMEKKMMHQLVGGRTARTGSPIEDLSDRELQDSVRNTKFLKALVGNNRRRANRSSPSFCLRSIQSELARERWWRADR